MLRYITVLFLILTINVSIGQVVLTQTQSDAAIGLDRKAWAGLGNTAPLSDGYAHDFTLPTSTDSCEQITGISIEIDFTGYINNGVCPHFETYFNLFYGCTTYSGGATCLPATNLIAEPNYPVNVNPAPFNFGNPLGSPVNSGIVPDFGDNFSIDIIPVSNPGCNPVSNGHISQEYTITVTVTIAEITPITPTGLECWETASFNNATCSWDITGTQPLQPTIGCWETATFNTTTCSWDVTGGTQPMAPTGLECWEVASFNNTTCLWEVSGFQPSPPTTIECWETRTFNTTTCSWDVTGTQPLAPTGLACWETASFNNTTCIWDITGTQPLQPTLECWEIATFNTMTCSWNVTGTQPLAPTGLACWETASFNNTTCIWDITGTQPLQPTLECWEMATFNTMTCSWDITGTQPLAPTGFACWETTSFNITTCTWDVTGIQPPQPTIECWEMATFNTMTCSWDVTGTQPLAPTGLECWEMANFNSTTCLWEISGTQPVAPTGLLCWQTAVFNVTQCQWEVQGTQPLEFREEFLVLCENEPIDLIANTNIINPSYDWASGEMTEMISVAVQGIYEVEVTDGCFTEIITFNVAQIDTPVIDKIETGESAIVVEVIGNSNYQYSIDGINYQSSNVFNALPSGLYTIFVKSFECDLIITQQHLHIYIQKFMTPNGDGNHDLFSLNLAPYFSNFKVYIFDRYGKLLYSATNTNAIWNGTFNGALMPSADYWYSIELDNQRFTGHFTLKR